ncbi:Thioredoxin peroxidase [Candidatus Clavichlamydia salmonicola]|uniref:peroxiredoxin n=1 Tax=Candidatus Clavichlamydia salmonicola TaxID=469812 RepID=UPI001891BE93|nr:peroxiredoxin [Candidatus Clavichlamydia salmonicola]MBF5050605.1 Thioredoxin peroxidase [Candidatus Clavichlamydia salmonicola]
MGVLVGKKAPDFSVKAIVDGQEKDVSLSSFLGQYVYLFFYPLDFTFVCPTELHAFQEKMSEFQQRNTVVLGCSIDSWFSHAAWLKTPKTQGGIEGVTYPLLSDINKHLARAYDVLKEDMGVAYRGSFLIDKEGIVRHQVVNDLHLGRSVEEALRMVDALIFFEKNGEVCPANWKKGAEGMRATSEGLQDYFKKD